MFVTTDLISVNEFFLDFILYLHIIFKNLFSILKEKFIDEIFIIGDIKDLKKLSVHYFNITALVIT